MSLKPRQGIEPRPLHQTAESAEINGVQVAVGDELLVKLPGTASPCIVRVTRIDLNDDGSVRDVTTAVWSTARGKHHKQRGMSRTITPDVAAAAPKK